MAKPDPPALRSHRYRQDSDDFFALCTNFVLTASLFLCFVLKVDVLAEQVDYVLTDDLREQHTFDSALLTVFFIGVIVSATVLGWCATARSHIIAHPRTSSHILAHARTHKITRLTLHRHTLDHSSDRTHDVRPRPQHVHSTSTHHDAHTWTHTRRATRARRLRSYYALIQLAEAARLPIVQLEATRLPPVLILSGDHNHHLFLSHIWSTGQDQCATIKQRLCLLLPGVHVFLDVDDLEDIGELEGYVRRSQVIMIFVSKGYFVSVNCLREARCAVAEAKPLALVHDPVRGGAALDFIRDEECPDELRSAVFDGRDVIEWHRIKDFQMVSLKLLAEQLLLGCPHLVEQHAIGPRPAPAAAAPNANAASTGKDGLDGKARGAEASARLSLPLCIPGELTSFVWHFWTPLTVFASPHNPGAREVLVSLRDGLFANNQRHAALATSESAHPFDVTTDAPPPLCELSSSSSSASAPTDPAMLHVLSTSTDDDTDASTTPPPQRAAQPTSPAGASLPPSPPPSPPPPPPLSSSHQAPPAQPARIFVLYLNKETFVGGAGRALADEVRRARACGFPLVMLHSTPDNADGCEFAHLFSTTPLDLIQGGLYKALALACHPVGGPFHAVSCCLLAREMGARRASTVGDVAHKIESQLSRTSSRLARPVPTRVALALR